MNISVIIPTYNGRHKIHNLIDALLKQSYLDFKLIIVVDGSSDDTSEWLKEQDFSTLQDFILIDQENSGRSVARNSGVNEVENGLMIFLDDDIIPDSDLIINHIKHHQNHRNSWLTAGSWVENKPLSNHFERYRLEMEETWRKSQTRRGKVKISFENLTVSSSNMSLSKELFNQLGGFDQDLTDNEDLDLCIRALNSGVDIYYDPKIESIHNDQINFEQYAKRITDYQLSLQRLLNKKPTYESYIKLYNPGLVKKSLVGIFRMLGFVNLNRLNFMEKIPYVFRRKLFDIVIGIELSKTHN
ncbi:glycosyltransferase family 2 protein [Ekhidna sp.]